MMTMGYLYLGLLRKEGDKLVEIRGAGYERVKLSKKDLNITGEGTLKNTRPISFPISAENWGWVSAIGAFTKRKGGELIYQGPLSSKQVIRAKDVPWLKRAALNIEQGSNNDN